ncbi:hypothetical protein ACT7DA_20990 [Bacillus pacificus]
MIACVIDWCQNDDFWHTNILSADKLRKQFDQLFMKMQADKKKQEKIKQGQNRVIRSKAQQKNDLLRGMMEKEEDQEYGSEIGHKVVLLLTSSYDMFEVTSEKVDLWSKMLEDQDARLVFEKAAHHIKTEQYPPSISQLREQKREHVANVGYLDNQVVFKIESMREGALKEVPHDKARNL